jgi:hypothetical protein
MNTIPRLRTHPLLLALSLGAALTLAPGAVRAQEIGENDFRISFQGGTGDLAFDARDPGIAHDPALDRYLVVWSGDGGPGHANNEMEIWGQMLAGDGSALGSEIEISAMGPPNDDDFDAMAPAVAFNPLDGEYLVVWYGDTLAGGLGDNELEIWGQLLDDGGVPIGSALRITEMGEQGDDARDPAVAFNPVDGEYLVVWSSFGDFGPPTSGEPEIFGQRLSAAGARVGPNEFRISDMGPDGFAGWLATTPDVVHDAVNNRYLVVWRGIDEIAGQNTGFEVFGQLLAADGSELGSNDLPVSDMGPLDDPDHFVWPHPKAAWNPLDQEYLVVWAGDDDIPPLVVGEYEVFGQRIDADGAQVGANDFRISDAGIDGSTDWLVYEVAVGFDALAGVYLVAWMGEDDLGGMAAHELEIFVQALGRGGQEIGPNDLRISDAGGTGSSAFDVESPAVAWRSGDAGFLVIWEGEDDVGGLIEEEFEIFGQRFLGGAPILFADGFESGDTSAWSSTVP